MTYQLEGRLLEVCDCNVLCPCWIGEDPDNGTCDAALAYHVDRGTVDGIDVSGHTLAFMAHIPGNVLQGNWRIVAFVDDEATDEQQEALLNVFTGRLGGPPADLAQLIGEVVAVERVPISFDVEEGKGTLRIGSSMAPAVEAEMASYMGATEKPTTLQETVFSTIPGSPAYVSKATRFRRNSSAYGLQDIDIQDNNAIQGHFHFEAA
ncbi:MAG: DUF1326 domain-containing protein [Rubrobacteraceae bacterium]|nr:DUF1326 domain-containing protein [Rubrobacteraceae bacterium]MCL6437407.1 DUF1326 domain-containing protein [Rubrobacteraceae bacterium]